jgi:hypothetical protein
MISPAALKQYGNKDIAFHPVGTGPSSSSNGSRPTT